MYEGVTYDVILKRMLARVPDKFDKREGSVIWDTHSPTAMELQNLYIELEYLIKNSYGDTAAREYLVLLCKDRGITPKPATKTVLRGKFVPDNLVTAGQRYNIGDMNYMVTGKMVEDAEGGWEVQCETAGSIGNQYLGTMLPMEYIRGLQTAELTEILVPGMDEEETEDLRKRYFESFDAQAFGGNQADYIAKVRGINGVGAVKITPVWNGGIRPSDLIPGDTVKSWYASAVKAAPEEAAAWLSAVYIAALEKKLTVGGAVLVTILDSDDYGAASNVLVDNVQTMLDPVQNAGEGYGLAPIGHVVNVKSAVPVSVDVSTRIVFDDGFGWDSLQALVADAVDGYLLELRRQWAESSRLVVRVSQVEARILAVHGIADIADTALNGKADNLMLGEYEVPIIGKVSGIV